MSNPTKRASENNPLQNVILQQLVNTSKKTTNVLPITMTDQFSIPDTARSSFHLSMLEASYFESPILHVLFNPIL